MSAATVEITIVNADGPRATSSQTFYLPAELPIEQISPTANKMMRAAAAAAGVEIPEPKEEY